jgi:hypothetical protein
VKPLLSLAFISAISRLRRYWLICCCVKPLLALAFISVVLTLGFPTGLFELFVFVFSLNEVSNLFFCYARLFFSIVIFDFWSCLSLLQSKIISLDLTKDLYWFLKLSSIFNSSLLLRNIFLLLLL